MASFGKKKPHIEYLYSKPAIAVLTCIVLFLSFAVFERFTIEREMHARRIDAEKERQEVLERKAQLEEKVQYLEGERGIEEEIRKHFDVAREGEQVVILIGDDEETKEAPSAPISKKARWYQFWK